MVEWGKGSDGHHGLQCAAFVYIRVHGQALVANSYLNTPTSQTYKQHILTVDLLHLERVSQYQPSLQRRTSSTSLSSHHTSSTMSSQSATYTNDAAQSQRHSTASELPPKYTASVDTFSIMTGKSGKSTSSKKVLGRIFQKKCTFKTDKSLTTSWY